MKNVFLLLLGCSLSLLACSTEDSTNLPTSESNSQENVTVLSTTSTSGGWDDFLRFDWARKSKKCKKGFGICTMQDKRDVIEEEKRRQELEDLAQNDVGLYQSNSIVAPIDPIDDFEGGVMDVIYDKEELLTTGQLQLDIKLAQAPTSTPTTLMVEESLSVDIEGVTFTLPMGNYEYNSALGTYGGYTITISN